MDFLRSSFNFITFSWNDRKHMPPPTLPKITPPMRITFPQKPLKNLKLSASSERTRPPLAPLTPRAPRAPRAPRPPQPQPQPPHPPELELVIFVVIVFLLFRGGLGFSAEERCASQLPCPLKLGGNVFVFGGTDGGRPLNDLHMLNTSNNTWVLLSVRGDSPEAREGHSAAIIGGCGKSESSGIYYDDLYILNTGGEDSSNFYLSDVHILDADTLVWCKLNTTGQLLPPRGGHTTIGFGKNLFVFGGFSDEQNLYDDVYMLNIDPEMGGVLVFIGGCNKHLEALDDMYYLRTGLSREDDRDERRNEKLSMRRQLKMKCQEEQHSISPAYEQSPFGVQQEHDNTVYQPMPISSYMPLGWQNLYLNEQTPNGKRPFQAKVTKGISNGYTIKTVLDGRLLRGVLFFNKPSSTSMCVDNFNRNMEEEAMKMGCPSTHSDLNADKHQVNDVNDARQANAETEIAAASETKISEAESSMPQEVPGASEAHLAPDVNFVNSAANNPPSVNAEIHEENVSAVAKDQSTPIS